jgi:tetratricopeptide (TPR) repeat protein
VHGKFAQLTFSDSSHYFWSQGKAFGEDSMRLFFGIRTLTVALTGLLCVVAPLAGQTRDDNWKRCAGSDSDLKIVGCTAFIQSGQESNEGLAQAFGHRGYAYVQKGNYDRAIQDYDEAIRLNPTFFGTFYARGDAYFYKNNYDRAIQDFDEAIRLNPSYAPAFHDRGSAYHNKANYDRAIQDYDQAIHLNPSYAEAFYSRGFAKHKTGNKAGGDADIAKAKQLDPKLGQ